MKVYSSSVLIARIFFREASARNPSHTGSNKKYTTDRQVSQALQRWYGKFLLVPSQMMRKNDHVLSFSCFVAAFEQFIMQFGWEVGNHKLYWTGCEKKVVILNLSDWPMDVMPWACLPACPGMERPFTRLRSGDNAPAFGKGNNKRSEFRGIFPLTASIAAGLWVPIVCHGYPTTEEWPKKLKGERMRWRTRMAKQATCGSQWAEEF